MGVQIAKGLIASCIRISHCPLCMPKPLRQLCYGLLAPMHTWHGTFARTMQASLQRFSLKSQQSHLSPSHLSSASSSVAGRNQMVDDVADAGG